jgi:hypothetical protein
MYPTLYILYLAYEEATNVQHELKSIHDITEPSKQLIGFANVTLVTIGNNDRSHPLPSHVSAKLKELCLPVRYKVSFPSDIPNLSTIALQPSADVYTFDYTVRGSEIGIHGYHWRLYWRLC